MLMNELTAIALTANKSSLGIIGQRLTDYSYTLMCLVVKIPGLCITRLTELHGSIELEQASLTHESILCWSNSLSIRQQVQGKVKGCAAYSLNNDCNGILRELCSILDFAHHRIFSGGGKGPQMY